MISTVMLLILIGIYAAGTTIAFAWGMRVGKALQVEPPKMPNPVEPISEAIANRMKKTEETTSVYD